MLREGGPFFAPALESVPTTGTVDEVDLSGTTPVLIIGSQKVPLSSVQTIGLSTSGT